MTWTINESIIPLEAALEYISRIIPKENIMDVQKHHRERIKPKQQNTRKKNGSGTRKKRK